MEGGLAEIERVAVLMNAIDGASCHQASSIEQINQAVLQIDRVTQQNAALVEEAAGAADCMRQGTKDMLESVQLFVLDRATATVAPRLLS
jgi:methyl-accepting chemotaxis protein